MRLRTARAPLASLLSFGALAAGTLAACSAAPGVSGHFIGGVAGTTITLEGPNQWTQSGSSFGPPWAQVVAEFKKVTGVTVNTDVLPLATFSSAESAQLAAGIAPDLVFNQATYQPYMVVPLSTYLSQPNPFVAGHKSWLSEFDQSAFSPKVTGTLDSKGNLDWVPFNLAGIAIRLGQLLAAPGITVINDGTNLLRVSGTTAEQIGTAAWRAHLPVYELTPTHASLEEAFMQVTKDSIEYHAGATR